MCPMKLPAFTPTSTWRPTPVSALPSWAGARRVGYDLETRDPQLTTLGPGVRRGGYIVGVSFAIEDGPGFYLPMRHEGGDNLDPEAVTNYLRDQARAFKGELVGANLPYDLDFSEEAGIVFDPKMTRDIQVAEPLIDENQLSYSLENIAARHSLPGKDETLLREAASVWGLDPKKDLWRLPARFVGPYGEQDARLPLTLLRRQERQIDEQKLWGIYDLESRLLRVLLKMRRRGVRVSFDRLAQVEQWAIGRETEALSEVTRLTGVRLTTEDTTKASALVPALLAIGAKLPLTEKSGQPSVKNDVLKALKHPVADHILVAKKFNKLRNTFVRSVRDHAIGDRIHCTFRQLRQENEGDDDDQGARYGRISCVDPNLQQQPARDKEIGPVWRSIYIPDEGGEWACNDYSQQEPRWTTHFAEASGCNGGAAAAQRYRDDPNLDNHQMMADLCQIPRDPAKQIYLGLCYGMGEVKLCRNLGLPVVFIDDPRTGEKKLRAGPEGRALFDKFHEGAPFVRELAQRCSKKAERVGFIITVLGRRCRFPLRTDGRRGYDWVHKALNRLIQGSSGDQTKAAMVAADDAGIRIQLQVHDELDLTIWDRKEAFELATVMKEVVPCNVPPKVDTEIGPNWGTLTKVKAA